MNFQEVLEEIQQNKRNHQEGYFNCIPFIGFDRLESFIPGLEQDTYYLVTANSGIGKSKFVRSLFIHVPYEYVKNNPDSGIQLKVIYFSLEESKKKIILAEISKYLHTKYGISISIKQLQSRGRYNTISEETLEKIKEAEEYVDDFLKVVDIVDSVRNPTGMYKYVMKYALEIGTYYDKEDQPLSKEDIYEITHPRYDSNGNTLGEAYKKVSYYKKYNPTHYVVVITYHIKIMSGEKDYPEGKPAMGKWSSDYCLRMRDKLGFIPVNVQQQASDKEKLEFTNMGKSIEEKLEPSLDGLGEHKLTQQDANIVFGLFAPNRYNIAEHNGYNILKLRDNYRSLSILKDRDGIANIKVPLFFDGATDFFKELPRADDTVGINKVYDYINQLKRREN